MRKCSTSLRLACGLLVGLPYLVQAATADEKRPAQAPKSMAVLEYLGQRASRLAAELPPIPEDTKAWEARRQQVRDELARILGLPERTAMRAGVLESAETDGLVFQDVQYLWHERAYVSATVVRRKGAAGRLPAIVMPPGWLGQLKYEYNRTFALHMARKGYLIIYVDDPHVGRRQAGNAGLYGLASAAGTQVMGIQVFDALRALDYLLTRDDVDPARIGIAGLCQGSEQTWLAAALEDRFKVVSPVCGTTTYEDWARMPFFNNRCLSDPSPYVERVLLHTDWHEINACIAPRPVLIASNSGDDWWPVPGFNKVVNTLNARYAAYGAPEKFEAIFDLRSHSMTPFIPEVDPWFEKYLKPLPTSDARPLPCGEPVDVDFNMIRYFQRRIVRQTDTFPSEFASANAWSDYRQRIVGWLAEACDLDGLKKDAPIVRERKTQEGFTTEMIDLPQDDGFNCPAMLYYCGRQADAARPAVVISHDGQGCMMEPSLVAAACELAEKGLVVMVPDHASLHPASGRSAESRGLVSLYGAADTVGLPPLAMRVWDNLSCVEHLCRRSDVNRREIMIAGQGVGGVDAMLAASLDDRITGVSALGAVTVQDWGEHVAPKRGPFHHVMPYLPGITTQTDLQFFYASVAPRPLVLVKCGKPASCLDSAFDRISVTCRSVFGLLESDASFIPVPPPDATGRLADRMEPTSQEKHLVTIAQALLPPMPVLGEAGTKQGLRSRTTIDTTGGIVWVLTNVNGYDQELARRAGRLQTWSFFNDNGTAQRGRKITPLLFKKESDGFRLIGIGTTRTNSGNGLQTFDFAVIAGRDNVGAGHYFGWHTGQPGGEHNTGVTEFDNNTEDEATILTLDGETGSQLVRVNTVYKVKVTVPRSYSIWAKAE